MHQAKKAQSKATDVRARFYKEGQTYYAVCFTHEELEWLARKIPRKDLRARVAEVLAL